MAVFLCFLVVAGRTFAFMHIFPGCEYVTQDFESGLYGIVRTDEGSMLNDLVYASRNPEEYLSLIHICLRANSGMMVM